MFLAKLYLVDHQGYAATLVQSMMASSSGCQRLGLAALVLAALHVHVRSSCWPWVHVHIVNSYPGPNLKQILVC